MKQLHSENSEIIALDSRTGGVKGLYVSLPLILIGFLILRPTFTGGIPLHPFILLLYVPLSIIAMGAIAFGFFGICGGFGIELNRKERLITEKLKLFGVVVREHSTRFRDVSQVLLTTTKRRSDGGSPKHKLVLVGEKCKFKIDEQSQNAEELRVLGQHISGFAGWQFKDETL